MLCDIAFVIKSVRVVFLFVFLKANDSTSDYLAAFVTYNLLIFYDLPFVSYKLWNILGPIYSINHLYGH
jgi:hypothetical protein